MEKLSGTAGLWGKKMAEIQVHPRVIELTEKVSFLKNELSSKIEEYDQLINHTIPNLEAEYQLKIGFKGYEKFSLECAIRRMRRKIQLIQALINNNKPVTLENIEKQLDEEFQEWKKQMDALFQQLLEAQIRIEAESLSKEESKELKDIYKRLVFLLHPDVNPNVTEKEKQLWFQVLEAYKNADLATLRTLAMIIEGDQPAEITQKSSIEYLEDRCAVLKGKIVAIINKIQTRNNSFPCDIAAKLQDEVWVSLQVHQMDEEIQKLSIEKEALESILAEFCV